ncbi:MAG: hypothetical protein MSC30_19540 [Gaiellaceae bacterium MAG52_C11]|nr:hypothetical protein [Candidatus Gaiellasilicea maunaloa]
MHIRGIPAKKQLTRELAILNHRYFQSRRPSLLAMVERLQRAHTRRDVRELQLDLIAELGAVEKVATEIDDERGSAALERLDALKLVEPKTPEVKRELGDAQDMLRRLDHMHVVVNAFRHVVRTIADGLVWRMFDHDRTALALLAAREAVAKHAPPEGFDAEMRAMDRLEHALDTVVIHNDSTYCLRHGDITAVIEIDGRRFPYLEEVKAGRSQAVRQKQAIADAVKRIHDGRLLIPAPFDTHLAHLVPLLADARATGYAEAKIDCRFVQAIDYRHFGGREERVGEILREADHKVGWLNGDRLILASIAGASRIHDRGDPVAEIAPVSIFPLPADDVVDMLMGAIDLRVHLNTELLALEFRKHGITVEFATGPAARQHFIYATRGYLGLHIPAYVREQMLTELLTSESLIGLVEWVLETGMTVHWAATGETPVIGFEDERPAWVAAGERIALTA